MPTKETGAIFVVKCPICNDELVVGWQRDELPTLSSTDDIETGKVKRKISTKSADDISNEKLTCTCGNVSAEFVEKKGRAVIDWVTKEPAVGNINIH